MIHRLPVLFVFSLILYSVPGFVTGQDFFQTKVAPIFQKKCVGCHNENDEDGGLSLQGAAEVFAGGDSGSIITPGKPNESSLLQYLSGDEPEMPKDADPLSADELLQITKWIKKGAVWPDGFRIPYRSRISKKWWSLQPIEKRTIEFQNDHPIDYFVRGKLGEHGMAFAPQADKSELVRRLYYDLIGLPPTPEQIDRFVKSTDPDAYARLVDKLLDSPRYGERWARHWLDVVQYGETHGYDKDKPRPNAWPYRDYVIRAFNEDKPYSRFVLEQLAGDVLFPTTRDGVVATGFIAAGPWDFIGHAEVPESKIDGQVARNLDRDNMVTSTMNTFCSVTVQCARCHNHKLDPITMEEYYNLQAVFASIDRADRDYETDIETAKKRQALKLAVNQAVAELKKLNDEMDRLKSRELRLLEKRLVDLRQQVKGGTRAPGVAENSRLGYHSQVSAQQNSVKWLQVDLGRPQMVDAVVIMGAVEYGFDDFGFPFRFVIEGSTNRDFSDPQLLFDQRESDFERPGNQPVVLPLDVAQPVRFLRLTATKLWNRRIKGEPETDDWIFAIGELAVINDRRLLSVSSVQSLDSIEAFPRWSRVNAVDHLFGNRNLESLIGKVESQTNGFHSQFAQNPDSSKWIQLTLNEPKSIKEIRVFPAFPTDFKETPGFGFPTRFKVELSNDKSFESSITVLDHSKNDFPNPGLKPLVINVSGDKPFQHIRLTANRLWNRGDADGKHFALAFSEIEVVTDSGLESGLLASASDTINTGRWHVNYVKDGYTSRLKVDSRTERLRELGGNATTRTELVRLKTQIDKLFKRDVGNTFITRHDFAKQKLHKLETELERLPPPSRVYAGTVHAGKGAFRGRAGLGPREIFVLHRGNVDAKREKAVPGTIAIIGDVDPRFKLPPSHHEGARRVALARWIVREDHPLTWRSIVNRVWQHHFGKGIVGSSNDFGRGGEAPTHPELLDWLAIEFRDGGKHLEKQSLKSLHRLICNSVTYKQSSRSESFEEIDGGNRFLWRMNRRRLSAEEIRDSVLQVCGLLDLKMGGPSYQDFVVQRPEHSPHYEYHLYDPNDRSTHRRAIYRFVVRSQPQPFMDTLDCADPSFSVPKRSETMTALQALGMLNNRFMVSMAENFADQLKSSGESVERQIVSGFRLLTGRSPTPTELGMLLEYAKQHGMKNLCRVLMNLNEFVFVD